MTSSSISASQLQRYQLAPTMAAVTPPSESDSNYCYYAVPDSQTEEHLISNSCYSMAVAGPGQRSSSPLLSPDGWKSLTGNNGDGKMWKPACGWDYGFLPDRSGAGTWWNAVSSCGYAMVGTACGVEDDLDSADVRRIPRRCLKHVGKLGNGDFAEV